MQHKKFLRICKSNFTLKATTVSLLYWLTDTLIHKYIYEQAFELIPSDMDELWMRSVIVILIICFGIYADKYTKSMMQKEEEKRLIYRATVVSSQHILNNLMNQMQYFKMIADKTNAFDDEVNDLYDKAINEGKELVNRLSSVKELTEQNIIDAVYPE